MFNANSFNNMFNQNTGYADPYGMNQVPNMVNKFFPTSSVEKHYEKVMSGFVKPFRYTLKRKKNDNIASSGSSIGGYFAGAFGSNHLVKVASNFMGLSKLVEACEGSNPWTAAVPVSSKFMFFIQRAMMPQGQNENRPRGVVHNSIIGVAQAGLHFMQDGMGRIGSNVARKLVEEVTDTLYSKKPGKAFNRGSKKPFKEPKW